jgi:hypothetical protein
MRALPVLVLISIGICLGLYMGWQVWQGRKNKPVMIGIHFLMGVAALEILVMLMAGGPDGVEMPGANLAQIAAGCIAGAVVIGIIAALTARYSRVAANISLIAHAASALTGFGFLIYWASSH